MFRNMQLATNMTLNARMFVKNTLAKTATKTSRENVQPVSVKMKCRQGLEKAKLFIVQYPRRQLSATYHGKGISAKIKACLFSVAKQPLQLQEPEKPTVQAYLPAAQLPGLKADTVPVAIPKHNAPTIILKLFWV